MLKKTLIILLCLISASVSFGQSIGPLKATAAKNEIFAGFGYGHTRHDWIATGYDVALFNGDTQHRINNVKTTDLLGRLIWGASEKITMSLMAGGSESEQGYFETPTGLIAGFGISTTIADWGSFSLGMAAKGLYHETDLNVKTADGSKVWGDMNWLDAIVAVGLNYENTDGPLILYAGPCLYWMRGKADIVERGAESLTARMDIENEHNGLGLVAGGQITIPAGIIQVEYLATESRQSIYLGWLIQLK